MGSADWIIIVVPLIAVIGMGCFIRRFIIGVSDFLVAGRICRRYVIISSNLANALSLVALAAYVESQYATGFALSFWMSLTLPLGIFISLSGYCLYRFRETKAMSLGQFLEMRYCRSLRIFACFLRSVAEIMANVILPALAARFFICYLGLPQTFPLLGWQCPTFLAIVVITLFLAISLICMGGALVVIATNALQGIILLPAALFLLIFLLTRFSISDEVLPVLSARIPGESFLNPFDISSLRDFNLIMLLVILSGMLLHTASGLTGTGNSAISPHETKMGAILGTWRTVFSTFFFTVIALTVITVLHHPNYAGDARAIRFDISRNIAGELIADNAERSEFMASIESIPEHGNTLEEGRLFARNDNPDEIYFHKAQENFDLTGEGSSKLQQFRTIFHQLMLPATMRRILPNGLSGLFCMMVLLFILSTDCSRIFSASSTLVQDCIVPFYRMETLPPNKHIFFLRIISVGVGILWGAGSWYMTQLDYINLFITIMYGMWLGGCGPMIVFGLYSRFGTSVGAWCSLLVGMGVNLSGALLQRYWADLIYPFLEKMGWVDDLGRILSGISSPFNPYLVWKMNRLKFPINSYEIYFIAMLTSVISYVMVSYLTCRAPFKLKQMLHREDAIDETVGLRPICALKIFFAKLTGVTPEYSCGDKIIAWSCFGYSFLYRFCIAFAAIIVFNIFSPWSLSSWKAYFFTVFLLVPGIIATIVVFWFGIGGIMDLRRMFRELKNRIADPRDNGMVDNCGSRQKVLSTLRRGN